MNLGQAKNLLKNPNFVKWFGKSKVVDDAGTPLRVYHGSTKNKINIIDPKAAVETEGVSWFSDNPDVSEIFRYPREYGEVLTDYYDDALDDYVSVKPGALVEGYLSIKNPLVVTGKEAQKITDDSAYQQKIIRDAISIGHDGIVLKNVREGVGDWVEPGTTYGIFSPTQIKSVKNEGTFDPTNPNILKGATAIAAGSTLLPKDALAKKHKKMESDQALQDAYSPVDMVIAGATGGATMGLRAISALADPVINYAIDRMLGD